MADQNRNQSNQQSQQGGGHPDDPSVDAGQTRGRSTTEPASSANDRDMRDSQRLRDDENAVDAEFGIESDLDDMNDVDDTEEGGRSNR